MTREEQISNGFTEMMKGFWGNQDLKVPDFEEPCKQEPCENVVSRQAAINIVKDMYGLARTDVLSDAVKQLKDLPSITPQKMGRWIVHPKGIYAQLVCSKCLSNAPYNCKTNYCPNCGAKMQEVEECRK